VADPSPGVARALNPCRPRRDAVRSGPRRC